MKRMVVAGCYLGVLCALLTGCQSDKNSGDVLVVSAKTSVPVMEVRPILMGSHSYLNEHNIGERLVITGKLHGSVGNWSVVENPDSKSRVTFILEVPLELEPLCTAAQGSVVKISGVLSDAQAVWTKKLVLFGIEKNPVL